MNMEEKNTSPLCVLILSDRLLNYAQKLADYLTSVGVQVAALVTSKEQALMFCDERIDFLIIAGYLKNQINYGVIKECGNRGFPAVAVHWAMLDDLISGYCRTYKIPLQFERTLPMDEFVLFLWQNRPLHLALPDEEVPDVQTKPDDKHLKFFVSKIIAFFRNFLFL
ncbi:hypothetical protein [Ruminiclostridium cellobioparum]|jgi:hypothetical protein|uniref:Stage 0 sporulation protein A homolog n=1 Tax=Ruminiclostridium cellobioparum subsp. termitidis CT1112 TaxID=1195236 RepID=S0FQI6_RUMCE|nr:hypothetical protein [Ruminiclostridium cellobioparum]EMS72631.1 hypothetical protein CTER_1340 [Ruminiclostridium cellobioparum subsp. termitidis CT1112]